MAAVWCSRFRRFPREEVDAAMSARRAASSTRAEVATLCRAGGALQLLLRSPTEQAADNARAVKEAAQSYYDALHSYGDGDEFTTSSVRPHTRQAFAHSPHSVQPSLRACYSQGSAAAVDGRSPSAPTSPCVMRWQFTAHAMYAPPLVNMRGASAGGQG
jgi:hypothetical protein